MEAAPSPPLPALLPRRRATLAGFLVLGTYWGAWAAVLPDVQRATGASKGALGVALLFAAAGSLPTMLLVAGPAVERHGARVVSLFGFAFAVATVLPGLATSVPVLALTLVAAGGCSGAFDVALNANAARIEALARTRLMPLAHGLYSVGLLGGAVAAGLLRAAGVGREPILLGVGVAVAAVSLLLHGDRAELRTGEPRRFHLERALVVIGIVGAAAFVVEGGIESWSALFLERHLDAEPAVSGLGPGVFGASMAAGRFLGQAAVGISDRLLLAGGAALAAAGCVIAATATTAPVALVGFALGGAGISLNAPIVFGAAGRRAAGAVATATTIGYAGLLIGPPLVGGVAQATSLRGSFLVLAVIAAVVAAVAARLSLDR
jgi:MFS family permease